MQPTDILILSNGPGELTTWVRPVVKALRQQLGNESNLVRISVVLSPCPHATGKETAIARSYPEVDRVQAPADFFPFLLWGKTAANWDWRKAGVVLFLGGDQFYSLIVGKRLGYSTVVYAEWDARWYRWLNRIGVRKQEIIARVPQKYHHKFTVVGDLMADVSEEGERGRGKGEGRQGDKGEKGDKEDKEDKGDKGDKKNSPLSPPSPLIGLLPGSKAAKLAQGVPLCLAIALQIQSQRPQTRFFIPVAPTVDLETLARFADPQQNPVLNLVGGVDARLVKTDDGAFLTTSQGLQIPLITRFPVYDLFSQCEICLTTVGANTAELTSLAVPMIVLIPTQQLDAMRSWDGFPGILANLPLCGTIFAKLINWLVIKQGRLFAWPNRWANEEIVPELVGNLKASEIASMVLDFLDRPEKLQQMRDRLSRVRGQPGAASQLAAIVSEELSNDTN